MQAPRRVLPLLAPPPGGAGPAAPGLPGEQAIKGRGTAWAIGHRFERHGRELHDDGWGGLDALAMCWRTRDDPPYGAADVTVMASLAVEAGRLLEQALAVRALARALAPFTD